MDDLENVFEKMKAAKEIVDDVSKDYFGFENFQRLQCACGYIGDALTLLRKQQPRVMTLEEAIETVSKEGGFVWIEEKNHPLSSPHIRPINSIYDCPVRKFKDYGKEFVPKRNTLRSMWRCWNSYPTKEQWEAIPWKN